MPNDRPRPGTPEGEPSEGPQFDWLYGKGRGQQPPPDATRMIPVQPRPDETAVRPPASGTARGRATTPP
ncbi:MAG: hypothetical protein WB767_16090, partial [Nocardioides sp.]